MSQRTALRPETVLSGDMSATSVASSATVLQGLSMLSYSVSWTGSTPVGTLELQFSNNYSLGPTGAVSNAGTWDSAQMDVNGALTSSITISGNTGHGYIDVTATGAYAARLLYTKGSGTGTITAVVAGKVA